jgi:hypothetical protein
MKSKPQPTQLLIRFSVPFGVGSQEHANSAAKSLSEQQCWGAYEVRKAKRYEDLRPDGTVWAKFEVWGQFDVTRLSAKVEAKLLEKATEGAKP